MNEEYVTRLPDGSLVRWKPLSWAEYRHLIRTHGDSLKGAAGWLLCEAAAALCFLDHDQDGHQVEFPDLYAGTVYSVGRQILEKTGFISTGEKVRQELAAARESVMSDWYEAALALVCAVFRKTEEEVREWSLRKFMHHCALVEIATGKQMPVVDETDKDEQKPTHYKTLPDGRKIPLLTRRDMERRRNQTAKNPDDPDLMQ